MSGHGTEPVGSIGWTERTRGVLTLREGLSLAGPLVRDEQRIAAGFLAMALRCHPGRRSVVDPAHLMPPDSSIAREAEEAARDLLTPVLLNHSHHAYAWGSTIAALHAVELVPAPVRPDRPDHPFRAVPRLAQQMHLEPSNEDARRLFQRGIEGPGRVARVHAHRQTALDLPNAP